MTGHTPDQPTPQRLTDLRAPITMDADRAEMMGSDLDAALEKIGASITQSDLHDLLIGVMSHSPYLARLIRTRAETVAALFKSYKSDIINDCANDFAVQKDVILARAQNAAKASSMTEMMKAVRNAKADLALTLALADLTGIWSMRQVTEGLSDLADTAVQAAACYLLRAAHNKGDLSLPDPDNPAHGCGLTVLAMGKLGARELNYSSDIDLIVLYDQDNTPYTGRKTLSEFFVRLTRDLVKAIGSITESGYVFRTDLRLRPDAAMTPIAMPLDVTISYYESTGLNWERAAMIKARPIGGDLSVGEQFLSDIRPFVWRRSLDFAAIDDVQDMTNKIRKQQRAGPLDLLGHNVKLGRGGIREIEFFVQTYQMILGGRNRKLRELATLDVLRLLVEEQAIDQTTCDRLSAAYIFLREVEHRLQMVNDEQTQKLPKLADELAAFSAFCGFASPDDFAHRFAEHDHNVREAYDTLLQISYASGDDNGSAPAKDDTIITADELSSLGYDDPDAAISILETWQSASYRALKSERARLVAKDIAPAILKALADADRPNEALVKFDDFLSRLPTGVQFFSLIRSHPWVLEELALLINASPRLSRQLERNPSLLDIFIDDQLLELLETTEGACSDLTFRLEAARSYEEMLDIARHWKNELEFLISARHLSGRLPTKTAAIYLSNLADAALLTLKPQVEAEFASKHGTVKGGELAIIALGRLGEQQMTPQSDLDLIFVFTADDNTPQSDGDKPLTTGLYFHRLTQRIINAISSPTAAGQLYEVDMRMRPQGKKGPIASRLDSFKFYYENDAWIFERQALTKARIIAASEKLRNDIGKVVHDAIEGHKIPADEIYGQIGLMRQRMLDAAKTPRPTDIKQVRGGLIDLEFIAQAQALTGALPRKLTDDERDLIDKSLKFYRSLLMGWRCNLDPTQIKTDPMGTMPIQLLANLCTILELPPQSRHKARLGMLDEQLDAIQNNVRALFDSLFQKRVEGDADNTPTLDDIPVEE